MKILALDTATEACSAALFLDGTVVYRETVAPQRHSQLILTMCTEVLAEAGVARQALDAVAFGRGPGSFTGVRIAAGVVQGIAYALDLPVVAISSLAALAQGAVREHAASHVLAAIDARMGEIYWGMYETGTDGLVADIAPEGLYTPERVPVPESGVWRGVGTAFDPYRAALTARLGTRLTACESARYPLARDLVALAVAAFGRGETVPAEAALPVYLRDEVVKRP